MYRVKTAKIMTADVYFHTDLRGEERQFGRCILDRLPYLPLRPVPHTEDKAGNDSAEIYITRDSIEDGDLGNTKDRIFKR